MRPEYQTAIDTRLDWLSWAQGAGERTWIALGYERAMPFYRECLQRAPTYVMAPPFCKLVDHARRTAPDDFAFDLDWLITPRGWLWIAEPFVCPTVEHQPGKAVMMPDEHGVPRVIPAEMMDTLRVHAIGWRRLEPGEQIVNAVTGTSERVHPDGAVHVATYQSFADYHERAAGFGCWSYLTINQGEHLGDRVARFEERQTAGKYADGWSPARDPGDRTDRRLHPLHEIRWIWVAFYMMAQRLAATMQITPDRATRRRMERAESLTEPTVQIVTLRRLAEKRDRQGPGREVEWTCQWEVSGHWRHLPDKKIWIEAFVKGPEDKPFRRTTKLFSAQR